MIQHSPKGLVVFWTAGFSGDDYKPPDTYQTWAVLIPHAEVATLDKVKDTIARRTQLGVRDNLSYIITNYVAYSNPYAHIDHGDWEMLCAMEAFDHIYPTVRLDNTLSYHIRVSKRLWKVDTM
ncbi:hypothetical protein BDD12DRAFT_891012 [Trichophaea hybrida]|nr:hypothetical protein BDD12DRAFT_891012 [Trichophaea hybrida]